MSITKPFADSPDPELLDCVARQAQLVWHKHSRDKMPRWFEPQQPEVISNLSASALMSLIKARNERLIDLELTIEPTRLWQSCQAWLKAQGIDDLETVEQVWTTMQPLVQRLVLHQHKIVAEEQLLDSLLGDWQAEIPSPLKINTPFLAIEPGLKSGLKLAVCQPDGEISSHSILFPHEPQNQWQQGLRKLDNCVRSNRINALVIATGEGYRECRRFVKQWLSERDSPMPVYRLNSLGLSQLLKQQTGEESDSLYATVNVICQLALFPEQNLRRIPLKCLLQHPLLTSVNQHKLSRRLEDQWQTLQSRLRSQSMPTDPLFDNQAIEFEQLSKGQIVNGQVINQTDYGYFIDIGVVENGLLHRSKMPQDMQLNNGQMVRVEVLNLHSDKRQISLGIQASKPSRANNKPASRGPQPGNSAMADALRAAFGGKENP